MTPPPAHPRAVLFNWLWLVGAQILVRLVALGYKVFLARVLHAQGYGIYAWVLAVVALSSIFAEAGFNRLLIRDIARDPERGPALLGAVTRFRFVLAVVVYGLMLGASALMRTDGVHLGGLAIAGLTLVVSMAGHTFDAAYYAIEQARYSGTSQLLVTVVGAVLGVGAVLLGFGLPGLFLSVALAESVRTVYLYLRLERFHMRPDWQASVPLWPLLRDAAPYALLGVLGVIYFRIDTVMLTPLRGDAETGIYTVAFKLFEVLLFVPGTLAAVVVPRMARYHRDDLERLRASHVRLTRLLFAAALPIGGALWFGAPVLVPRLFGAEYLPSVPVLQVLAVTFLFHCLHLPNGAVVLSGRVLAPVVWLSVGTAGFNVLLNLYYIPRYGAMAAAGTTLASEILSWVVFTVFVHRRVVALHGWGGAVCRPAAAAVCAAAAGLLLARWPLVALAAAGVVFGVTGIRFGAVGAEDVALLGRGAADRDAGQPPVDLS